MAQIQSPKPSAAERFEAVGRFGLGGLLFALPLFFWLGTHDQFELPKLTLLRLATLGILGAWLLAQGASPALRWRRTPLDLPLLLWSLWLVVQTIHSVSPSVSWRGEYENFAGSLTQLNYSLLFWLTAQLVRSREIALRLLMCLELSSVAVAAYALMQALKLDWVSWSSSSVVEGRYFASMGNPNFLGALMVMALALLFARLLGMSQVPEARRQWRLWIYLLALPFFWALMYRLFPEPKPFQLSAILSGAQRGAIWTLGALLAGLAAAAWLLRQGRLQLSAWLLAMLEGLLLFKALADTGTRGAFAGLLAVAALFAALGLRRLWPRLAALPPAARSARIALYSFGLLLLLVLASFSLGPQLRQRMAFTLLHPLRAFDESRMQIWVPALKIARDFPFFGTGVDTFKTVFPQYQSSAFNRYDGENVSSRMAHCEPLQILATMGVTGLLLWAWLLWVFFRSLLQALRRADSSQASLPTAVLGLAVGYLVQNLVSFGVSAISAPFFIAMALGLAPESLPEGRLWRPRWAGPALVLVAAAAALWGGRHAWEIFQADKFYAFGNLVTAQLPRLAQGSLDEARGAAAFALEGLKENVGAGEEALAERQFWYQRLAWLEQQPRATALEEERLLPAYREAAASLLLLLSAARQEQGVALCPGEVKYRVYLGLAYEELFKRSQSPLARQRWFARSEAAYSQGARMNPRNAYYHGNLGRLYSQRASEGAAWLEKAEAKYRDAIALAPVTRLFYENLLLMWGEQDLPQRAGPLLDSLEARDPILAARVCGFAAGAYWQLAASREQGGAHDKAGRLRATSRDLMARARRLDPSNPDYAYLQAAADFAQGRRGEARSRLEEALRLDPSHEPSRRLKAAMGLRP